MPATISHTYTKNGVTVHVRQLRGKPEDNTITYWVVLWDATGKVTGKSYRACSSPLTHWNQALALHNRKPNARIEEDRCAMFL